MDMSTGIINFHACLAEELGELKLKYSIGGVENMDD
jgi:hypothetical protein